MAEQDGDSLESLAIRLTQLEGIVRTLAEQVHTLTDGMKSSKENNHKLLLALRKFAERAPV
jgi:hypothetical protein